jgi:hypothetical protein
MLQYFIYHVNMNVLLIVGVKVGKVEYLQASFLGTVGYVHDVHGVKTHWRGRIRQ